jgi:membrane fusion protein, multidrug efflux system
MRKILFVLGISFLMVSCSHSNSANKTDKTAELEKLQKQYNDLGDKIKQLQSNIKAGSKTLNLQDAVLVNTVVIKPVDFNHYIEIEGRVESNHDVYIDPQQPGTITAVNANAGEHVVVGQVLATMDDAVLEQSVQEVQNQLDLAKTLYTKQKALWDQQIGTEVQYIEAKNNVESLQKRLATIQSQIDMTKIKSPIDGIVDAVNTKIGETAAPGMKTFHVVNFSDMKVVADIGENYIGAVKVGDMVSINFPDLNKVITKPVSVVSRTIDPIKRAFSLEIKLTGEDQSQFYPNMVAILKIRDYENEKALTVPINVVQNSDEGSFIFIADNSSGKLLAEKVKISLGLAYGNNVEVLSGLKVGDQIITIGYQDLSDGQLIKN